MWSFLMLIKRINDYDGGLLVNEQINMVSSQVKMWCCYLINMQISSNLNTLGKHYFPIVFTKLYTNVNCQTIRIFSGCAFIWQLMFVYQFMNKSAVMYAFRIICFYISKLLRKSTLKTCFFLFFINFSNIFSIIQITVNLRKAYITMYWIMNWNVYKVSHLNSIIEQTTKK